MQAFECLGPHEECVFACVNSDATLAFAGIEALERSKPVVLDEDGAQCTTFYIIKRQHGNFFLYWRYVTTTSMSALVALVNAQLPGVTTTAVSW